MKKTVPILLVFCLLLSAFPSGTTAHGETLYDPTMKIGLYYDSSALAAANLQNVTGMGTGYEFGYYDAQRNFIATDAISSENQITVLKNTNLWITSDAAYYDARPSSFASVIGAYCWQVNERYTDVQTARSVRDRVQMAGYLSYLCYVRGGYRVRVGAYTSSDEANTALPGLQSATGLSLVMRSPSETCYTVVITGTSNILYQLDLSGDYPLGIRPMSQQTWFKGYKYYGGFEYRRSTGNNLSVINVVGLTDYIKGVIPYEVSNSWPIEAQKAMALCAKCYSLNNANKHKSKGFDLCNSTDCQVYRGTNQANSTSDAAVEAVNGLYVLYGGQVCQTYYHSSSGGFTEDVGNIWGTDVPYLKAVQDIYLEKLLPFSYTLTLDDITWILQNKSYTKQSIKDMYVSKYSAVGNVLSLTFVQADGTLLTLSGDRARTALNSTTKGISIGSHHYTITGGTGGGGQLYVNGANPVSSNELFAVGGSGGVSAVNGGGSLQVMTGSGLQSTTPASGGDNSSGVYTVSGTGSGHNIGLSQWGAYAMAKKGFTYDEIIRFYYTGVTVGYYQGN